MRDSLLAGFVCAQSPAAAAQLGVRPLDFMRIMDVVMTVANVTVMAVGASILMRFTSLPHWACLVIGAPGGIAVFWLILFKLAKSRSPRHARSYADLLGQAVRSRPEFARVAIANYANGTIGVGGRVASPADLESLRQLVENTRPPVTVRYSVAVNKA